MSKSIPGLWGGRTSKYCCLNTSGNVVVQSGTEEMPCAIARTMEQGFSMHRWNSTFQVTQSIDGLCFQSQSSPSMSLWVSYFPRRQVMVSRCPSPRSMITFAMWVINPFAFIVPSALQVTIGEQSWVVGKLLCFANSASMTEAVQPLSMSAVTIVVWSDCGFRKLTLISKDKVPGFPCMVTVLRSSFGADTESEDIFNGGRG